MSRNYLNFWLDAAFFIALLGLIATGGILYFVLPPGTGHTLALFGLGRHDYGAIHGYLAAISVGLLLAHLLLHWSWIVCVVGRAFGKERPSRLSSVAWCLSLFLGIIAVLGGGLFWASTKVTPWATQQLHGAGPGRERARSFVDGHVGDRHDSVGIEATEKTRSNDRSARRGLSAALVDKHAEECAAGKAINGRTSLKRAADLAGATVDELRLFMALPQDVDSEERLGRLRRIYGFSIHDVRRWACRKSETD